MRPQEVWVRDIKVGLRLVCIRAPPLAVPQVAAPEALATVSFPAPQGLKPNFPSNPTARLKPCPDTKPKTKPRVPLRSDSCEFRRIGSSATFVSHTPGWEALRRGIRLDYNGATKRGTASGDTEWSRPPLVAELVGYL